MNPDMSIGGILSHTLIHESEMHMGTRSVGATLTGDFDNLISDKLIFSAPHDSTEFPINKTADLKAANDNTLAEHAKRPPNGGIYNKTLIKRARRAQILHAKDPEPDDRQKHIVTERQRRSSMNELLTTMGSLLPIRRPSTVDKCTLISECINHIHSLQKTLKHLQQERDQLVAASDSLLGEHPIDPTACIFMGHGLHSLTSKVSEQHAQSEQIRSGQVQVACSENEFFITLTSCKRRSFFSELMQVLEERKLETISCTVSTSNDMMFAATHAKASGHSEHTKRDAILSALQSLVSKTH